MTLGNVPISARMKSQTEPLKRMMDDFGVKLRVAMPGIIQSFDSAKQTVTVQLVIREKLSLGGQPYQDVAIPIIEDVPVFMPRAGNFVLTMPITAGDECLVIFADSCIDSWWESGALGNQMDRRRHDLSDGIALVGIWSQPKVVSSYSSDAAVLRNLNNDSYVEVKNDTINVVASNVNVQANQASIEAETVSIEGSTSITIDGNSTTSIDGKIFLPHKHSGVTTGPGQTGGVV